jgi:hypothetical protein
VCELGGRRPALRGADYNHHTADDILFYNVEHDGDNARNARHTAVDDDVVEHNEHHADAGGWLADHYDHIEHNHDARQLPHAAC